jgi:hyperosmotically inducible periplasmic protein
VTTFESFRHLILLDGVNALEVVMNTGNRMKSMILKASLAVVCLAGFSFASIPKRSASLDDKVRHELLMLPYYSVFDTLSFTVDSSNTVTLQGEVRRPILKSDAEAAVRGIQGIGRVVNNIEVLPESPFDDRIRIAMYRAIFSRPGFEKYAIQAQSPIRIIVKNGDVTLEGFVDTSLDKQLAETAARLVSGVFRVTNNLSVS